MYVKLTFSHQSFNTAKTAIVTLTDYCDYLTTYEKLAKEKVCQELNLDESEVCVFDCKVLGDDTDVIFVK